MKIEDVKIGMRVQRNSGASSFVRDNPANKLQGRRVGIVITEPKKSGTSSLRTVDVVWVPLDRQIELAQILAGNTRFARETICIHRLIAVDRYPEAKLAED